MMITYALTSLLLCEYIDAVYIVADSERSDSIIEDIRNVVDDTSKIKGFAAPGKNRQTSALSGMQMILHSVSASNDLSDIGDGDTVLIHDAARPFLSAEMLKSIYEALTGHDGVMPALPVKDTVYSSNDGKTVSGLLDRRTVYAGQAPELFLLKKYYRANLALMPEKIYEINGASEPAFLFGMDIALIPGDEDNFKVTSDNDLKRFTVIKENRSQ